MGERETFVFPKGTRSSLLILINVYLNLCAIRTNAEAKLEILRALAPQTFPSMKYVWHVAFGRQFIAFSLYFSAEGGDANENHQTWWCMAH